MNSIKIYDHRGKEAKIENKLTSWDKLGMILFLIFLTAIISAGSILIYSKFSMSEKKPGSTEKSEWSNTATYYYRGEPSTSEPTLVIYNDQEEVLADGNCVDKASAILFILKRHYVAMDKIMVAISQDHCQVVLDEVVTKTFLKLKDGRKVIKGQSEFTKGINIAYIPYEVFLEAAEYYRPSISITDLLQFIANKNKNILNKEER